MKYKFFFIIHDVINFFQSHHVFMNSVIQCVIRTYVPYLVEQINCRVSQQVLDRDLAKSITKSQTTKKFVKLCLRSSWVSLKDPADPD